MLSLGVTERQTMDHFGIRVVISSNLSASPIVGFAENPSTREHARVANPDRKYLLSRAKS
jgi:hypothetical protein